MRTLAHFILGLALIFALILAAPARADNAMAEASEQEGYGRLVLTFEDPPAVQTNLAGSILVLTFSKPVDVNVDPVARGLASFVSIARRDPDGMAIRLGLSRRVKVNTMAAGEKVFVDLMPENWVGMPPPLPQDVIADLTRRALDADRIKKELARAQTLPPVTMQLASGSNEDRIRLTFTFSDKVEVRFKTERNYGILTVPGTVQFDAVTARTQLPPEIMEFKAEVVGEALVVRFAAEAGKQLRGSAEDRSFVIDIAAPEKFDPAAQAQPQKGASKEVPVPSAPPDKTAAVHVEGEWESAETGDYAEDAAPEPVIEPAEIPKPYVPPASAQKTAQNMAPPAAAPEANPVPQPVPKPAAVAEAPKPAAVEAPRPALAETPKPAEAPKVAETPKPATAEPEDPKRLTEGGSEQPAPKEPEKADYLLSDAQRSVRDLAAAAAKDGVQVHTAGTTLQIAFPFPNLPAAAAFIRGETVFVVFDAKNVDASRIVRNSKGVITAARTQPTGAGTALELTLDEPRLISMANADRTWILSLGETIVEPTRPVQLEPTFGEGGKTALRTKLEGLGALHRVTDSKVGDRLQVVTLRSPTRGTVRGREFIEFRALPTAQGLAFEPFADDFDVKVTATDVTLTRAEGLTLSLDAMTPVAQPRELQPNSPFSKEAWRRAQIASISRGNELARVAAAASPAERTQARLQLARFNLANGNAAETKTILDVAAADSPGLADEPDVRLMQGTAAVMLRRFDEAVKVLSSGDLVDNGEAALWLMVAEAGRGRIALAREAFRKGEPVLAAMPADLQRIFRQTMAEIAIAAQDFATAAAQIDALDTLNVAEGWAQREVMRGRIAEGFEQPAVALEAYRRALDSGDEIAMAEARLRATNLRYKLNETTRADAIKTLEQLTAYWRGDKTEAVALASLTVLYKEDHRWRDAFTTMRVATDYHPDEPSTRAIQDEMTAEFARLFLGEGDDAAPPTLESVALFYDFKELTPPGRQGDELIRKLADRLVEVDLLTQAADLLTYQIKNRLQGVARAQVAAHAAAIELMNRKPNLALNVLHETRIANLAPDLIRSRLTLEARALSELQRPDIAMEMIAGLSGDDINRLRADILWSANRWQSAAEALELMLGDSWSQAEALDEIARQDVLRAAIAYALAEDQLGLDRLRAKYGAKMAATPDQHSFNVVTAPEGTRGEEFRDLAKTVFLADTLKGFLEDYRKRYPESAPPMVRMNSGAEKTADARPI